MIEWWQALLISVCTSIATGAFVLGASYLSSRFAARAAHESDARRAAEQRAFVVRQACRESREQRVKPFYEFIEHARAEVTLMETAKVIEQSYEMNVLNVKGKYSKEEFMETTLERYPSPPLR